MPSLKEEKMARREAVSHGYGKQMVIHLWYVCSQNINVGCVNKVCGKESRKHEQGYCRLRCHMMSFRPLQVKADWPVEVCDRNDSVGHHVSCAGKVPT